MHAPRRQFVMLGAEERAAQWAPRLDVAVAAELLAFAFENVGLSHDCLYSPPSLMDPQTQALLVIPIGGAVLYAIGLGVRWLFYTELKHHTPDVYASTDDGPQPRSPWERAKSE